jgi:hypothetical protein
VVQELLRHGSARSTTAASAAAGPVGQHTSANTDWKLDTKVLTYSRAKGALAGLTLGRHSNDQAPVGKELNGEQAIEGRSAVGGSGIPARALAHINSTVRAAAILP